MISGREATLFGLKGRNFRAEWGGLNNASQFLNP